MDIGNLDIFNKKKDENKTDERSNSTNGKKHMSLNDKMHQVGDYDITTSSSGQTKTNESSDKNIGKHESSTSSAKRAAADAIATVGSVIAPTTGTSSAASKHNDT